MTRRTERALVIAMAGALAIAPFVFVNESFDPANLPQSAWVQVCGLAFAAVALARAERLGAANVDAPLATLIAWGACSIAWATSRGDAVPVALQWIGCGAWYLAVSRTITLASEARLLAAAVYASGAAVALVGLAQEFFALTVFYQASAPAATFVSRNIAAQYVVVTLPLGLAALGEWRPPRVAAAIALLAASSMLVFLTLAHTRSALVALAVEIAVVGWVRLPDRRSQLSRALLATVVMVGIVVATIPALRDRARGVLLPGTAGGGPATGFTSVQARQAIWLSTAVMIADAPVRGVGLGNFHVHYPPYARRVAVDEILSASRQLDHAHNDLLELAADAGLVAIALAAWLAMRALRSGRAAAATLGPSPLAVGWAAAAAGLATESLVSFPMQRALPPAVVAVGLGATAALAGLRPGAGRAAGRGLALAAAVGVVLVAGHQWRALEADRHVGRMIAAETLEDWPRVSDEATAALALVPRRREALFGLGTAELAQGRLPAAGAALRTLLEEHPHDLPALGNLALAQQAARDDVAALETWARVLALDPRDHRAHFSRGTILEGLGAVGPALDAYRLAVAFNPGDARYEARLAQAEARAGQSR